MEVMNGMSEKQAKTFTITTLIVAVVIAAGAAFYGGMQYQKNKAPQDTGGFRGQFGQNGSGQRRGMTGGSGTRPVTGEILSADNTSITVKLPDGSSKIVILSDKTTINKAAEATKTDLTAGTNIAAFGTQNTDGSVTAVSIQLNPTFRGMMGTIQPTP